VVKANQKGGNWKLATAKKAALPGLITGA